VNEKVFEGIIKHRSSRRQVIALQESHLPFFVEALPFLFAVKKFQIYQLLSASRIA
jgi:hypothetical protein